MVVHQNMLIAFLTLFLFLSPAKAVDTEHIHNGIKAGIEIEITKPCKYVPLEGEKNLRHKKLLEIKSDSEEILFWIEVDSSNKDIEIVTPPFKFPMEHETLSQTLRGIDKFVGFLKGMINPETRGKQITINPEALLILNAELQTVGLKCELISAFDLFISKKGEISARPQLSFQIPSLKVKRFLSYYLEPEKNGIFSADEKSIIEALETEEQPIDGLRNLIVYYIENLKLKTKSQRQDFHKRFYLLSDVKRKTFGEYLFPFLPDDLTSLSNFQNLFENSTSQATQQKIQENYINLHKATEIMQSQETGLKQFFPIMSRLAFSDIYNLIKTPVNRGRLERSIRDKYLDWNSPIEFPSYAITKNPLYKVDIIQPSDFYYPYKYLKADMTGYKLTIAEWFQSIVTPQASKLRPLRARLKDLARMSKGLAKQNLTLKGFEDMSSFSSYLTDTMFSVNNGKDLMSPPAFTSYDDSMGALDIQQLDPKFGEIILEVRRYADFLENHNPECLKDLIFLEIRSIFEYLFRE